jgi:hypothetical protein
MEVQGYIPQPGITDASQSKLNSSSSFTDSADSKLCGSHTLNIPVAEGKLSDICGYPILAVDFLHSGFHTQP